MIFDSHAHYENPRFNSDRHQLLSSLPERGVGLVLNAGWDMESSAQSVALAKKYPHIYASVGIHPEAAEELTDDTLLAIERFCREEKVVALGEIGLDFHYDSPLPPVQLIAFEKQLQLARELDIPVIVHSRDAAMQTFDLVKKYRPRGVVHCFSGSAELAIAYAKLGLYVGLTGVVTFHNAVKPLEVAKAVPADKLVIETDCPYMAPVPYRGKRCDSTMLTEVAKAIAAVRGTDSESIIAQTYDNAKRLYEIL